MSRLIIFTYSLLLWGWNSVRWRNIMSYKLSDTHFLTICNPTLQNCSTKPVPGLSGCPDWESFYVLADKMVIRWLLACRTKVITTGSQYFPLAAPPLISNDSININSLIRVSPVDRKPLCVLQWNKYFLYFSLLGHRGLWLSGKKDLCWNIIHIFCIL